MVVSQPWLVALPLTAVVRVMSADEAVVSQGGVQLDGRRWQVRSLAGALGSAAPSEAVALVLLASAGPPVALATGRCLQVGVLPSAIVRMPIAAARDRRVMTCFATGTLGEAHGLAPFGLVIDPSRLGPQP